MVDARIASFTFGDSGVAGWNANWAVRGLVMPAFGEKAFASSGLIFVGGWVEKESARSDSLPVS